MYLGEFSFLFRCDNIDKEMKERKKVLYKQRKRINLLEKQLAQSSGAEQKEGLNPEELEDYENDRQAEWDLIHREKGLLSDMEDKFRQAQEQAEVQIGKAFVSLFKIKPESHLGMNFFPVRAKDTPQGWGVGKGELHEFPFW